MVQLTRVPRLPRRGGGRLLFGLGHQHPWVLVVVIVAVVLVAIALSRRR